jgi:hypothetical protein
VLGGERFSTDEKNHRREQLFCSEKCRELFVRVTEMEASVGEVVELQKGYVEK